MTKDNNLLGKFELSNIPPAGRGIPQIEVTFDIDANGILNVSAVEKCSGKETKIAITNQCRKLNKAEIEKMVKDAEAYRDEDELQKERMRAKNDLEAYCFHVRTLVDEDNERPQARMLESERAVVTAKCQETIIWMDNNAGADKASFEKKKSELEAVCETFLSRINDLSVDSGTGGPTIEEVD